MKDNLEELIKLKLKQIISEAVDDLRNERTAPNDLLLNSSHVAVTPEKFSEQTGIRPGVIRGWLNNPRITEVRKIRLGKWVLVDMEHFVASTRA